MGKAIVIGASSGIGLELAKLLGGDGYELGLVARRTELLEELAAQIPTRTYVKTIDVTRTEEARRSLEALISEMGGVDLIVLSSGVSHKNTSWEQDLEMMETNVVGFTAMAHVAMDYFLRRGTGHLVALSSIAGLRGARANAPVYGATKAFISNYVEALRFLAVKAGLPIHVTDVKPGYVATPMTEGQEGMFWVASVDEAAQQIYDAIKRKKRDAYVTKRWRLIAWVMKILPYPLAKPIVKRL